MRLKVLFTFFVCLVAFFSNAQDVIYWSGSSANGNWEWGNNSCNTNTGGHWYWITSGAGDRWRPDCYATFNKIYFDNGANTIMNLNSLSDFSANQIVFINGTPDRVINTDASRSIYFQNNNGNCKIENYVTFTTHTFNVPIFINSGGNYMEINPVNGFLNFSNTITNNSNYPINIYGAQQVTFTGDITGNQGITINDTATVVYSGVPKTYSGTTTVNAGTTLKISSNQTLGAVALNGGTLQIDPNVTLTISGNYSAATGAIINNLGTIKFAGGSVTFPGSATVNNGTANTLTSLEATTTGTLTLNTLLRATGSVTVSSGTLLLSGFDLRLSNANLNVATGATFDTGGENQIVNEGSSSITISGTFITRDKDGFVGTNTSIPSITPTLNAGCTIEYGLGGDQVVQGSRSYFNLTISNSGTKTLSSAITNSNTITGTVLIKDAAILEVENKSFGNSGTNLTMTGTAEFRTAGTGVKPDIAGTYSLGIGTKITFSNTATTLESIRLAPKYFNIDVSGTSVGTDTATGGIDFQAGGTLTVKSTGTFKFSNITGFSGGSQTAISNVNNPTITLEPGSTIEYAGDNQSITLVPVTTAYSNLTVSGTGTKTIPTQLFVGNNLSVNASTLLLESGKALTVTNNVVVNPSATMTINDSGSLVQINDAAVNAGNIRYERTTPLIISTDYTYWSSPVAGYTLGGVSKNLTIGDKYYSYDSTNEDWKQESASTTMVPGIGYIIRGPGPEPSGPLPPSAINFNAFFIGTPNNGAYPISGLVPDKSYLLGNPYPSALDADTFLNDNDGVLNGTLYFWTHNTPRDLAANITNPDPNWAYAYSLDDYAVYNITGGIGIDPGTVTESAPSDPQHSISGIDLGKKPTGKIAAGQGFFASTKTIISGFPPQILYNNNMRVGVINILNEDNSQFFKTRNPKAKTTAIEKHRIWLNLTNTQGVFKQTLVGYLTDASNEYDNRFDGISFDGNEFADFYSVNQDKNLVIQGRALPFDENDEVPLGFRTTIDGDFTINIDETDGELKNQAVFIEDKLTNTIFDLRSGAYTFTTKSGTFNDRFILRYTNKTLRTGDLVTLENQVLVSLKNKQIKVNSAVEIIDKVMVYDLLGRLLFKKEKVNSNELAIPNLVSSQQTLLVKVILQNGQTVTKKIIY